MIPLSEVVLELYGWTLQIALFLIAHTANKVPPSYIKQTSCEFVGVSVGFSAKAPSGMT